MNPPQITKKEVFEVNGCRFDSAADALSYITQTTQAAEKLNRNREKLDATGFTYIPVWLEDQQQVEIMFKQAVENSNNRLEWFGLKESQQLRYYNEEIVILSPDAWMAKFKEDHRTHIDTDEWNAFLMGVIYINERCAAPIDWKDLLLMVATMRVTPQYIYSD